MIQEALRVATTDVFAASRLANAVSEIDLKSTSRLIKAAILLKKDAYSASASYGEFKRRKDSAGFNEFLDQLEAVLMDVYAMARYGLGMDLVPFNNMVSAFMSYREYAQAPKFKVPPPNSRVTLGLKGVREGAAAVIDSMQGLKAADGLVPQDVAVLGISLEMILDNLYEVARGLKMSPPIFDRARRELRKFVQRIENEILESVPPGGDVQEIPADQIVLAKVRRASGYVTTHPWLAYRMFEEAVGMKHVEPLSFRVARRFRS